MAKAVWIAFMFSFRLVTVFCGLLSLR